MSAHVYDGIWELMVYTFIDQIVNTDPIPEKKKKKSSKSEMSKSNKIKMWGFEVGSKIIDTIMI